VGGISPAIGEHEHGHSNGQQQQCDRHETRPMHKDEMTGIVAK